MKAIVDLFSTDYGLFSISGIIFMIGMAIWFYRFFFIPVLLAMAPAYLWRMRRRGW